MKKPKRLDPPGPPCNHKIKGAFSLNCNKDQKMNLTYIMKIQLQTMNMDHLLNKPYVNEVTLNGQNLYSKSC